MGMIPLTTWMLANGILDAVYLRRELNIQLEEVLQICTDNFGVKKNKKKQTKKNNED